MRLGSLALSLLLLGASARAAETEFLSTVSPADKVASGISHLTAGQQAALDRFANRDITLAREGDVTGFSGSFSERRTDQERKEAGIDTLARRELDNLDALVATAIADHPIRFQATAPTAAHATPPPSIVLTPPKLEVHGDLTLMAGAGSGGRSFYGTAMDVVMTDPSGKFTLAVGYSVIRSKGYPPCLFDPAVGYPALLP
jgi:hypothetical protein